MSEAQEAKVHTWTDERREHAKQLWQSGLSATQISRMLGTPYVTRNAVIGLITRAGLMRGKPRRTKPHHVRAQPTAKPKPKTKTFVNAVSVAHHREARKFDPKPGTPVARTKVSIPEPVSLCVPLLELKPWHCRWPSEGLPTTSCGAPQANDSSYCDHHAARSVVPAVARRARTR